MKKGKPKLIRTVQAGDIIKLWIKETGELILIPYENEDDTEGSNTETTN